jgi:hypothetical protein
MYNSKHYAASCDCVGTKTVPVTIASVTVVSAAVETCQTGLPL